MSMVIRSDDFPVGERFDRWREQASRSTLAADLIAPRPDGYRAELRVLPLGSVRVQSVLTTPCRTVRTPQMVRQSDPEIINLVLSQHGRTSLDQARNHVAMRPSDLAFYGSWRPSSVLALRANNRPICGISAMIPRARIPFSLDKVDRLTATAVPGRSGIGALLANFLTGLITDIDLHYQAPHAARLGNIAADLVSTLIADLLGDTDALPWDTRQQVLLTQIKAFIQQHLADPGLTPAAVAAAHHISLRTLHRLFQAGNNSAASWIREQRLERCHHDLADPALRHRSVLAIATRWGFTDPAHFSRLFRSTYGLAPRDYRTLFHPSRGWHE